MHLFLLIYVAIKKQLQRCKCRSHIDMSSPVYPLYCLFFFLILFILCFSFCHSSVSLEYPEGKLYIAYLGPFSISKIDNKKKKSELKYNIIIHVEEFSKITRAKVKDRTSVKFQCKTTHSHNFNARLHTALPNSPNLTSQLTYLTFKSRLHTLPKTTHSKARFT